MQNAKKSRPGGKVAKIDRKLADDCRAKRLQLGMTLETFWRSLGVAKSAGCRYEQYERGIPEIIRILFHLRYGSRADGIISKYGDNGRRFLEMLQHQDVRDAAWLILQGGRVA